MSLWFRQIYALTRKIFLITTIHRWRTTLLQAFVIPILILALVLQIPNFTDNGSQYGVGKPLPIQNLSDSLPTGAKLIFVRPSNSASDISTVINKVTNSLGNQARVESAENESELLKRCPTSLNGATDCYAAIIFNDSPLSSSGVKAWNYTIRVSAARATFTFDVHKRPKNDYASLQLAVENAITNSTTTPNSYMYTRITQDKAEKLKRPDAAAMMLSGGGVLCFLSTIFSVFHMTGMIAMEREAGMAQLIDIMTGGAASARVLSYTIAFDIIYLPSWVIFGALYSRLLIISSRAGILILWQILSGCALTSASVFAATFKIRYSAICVVAVMVLFAALATQVDNWPGNISFYLIMVLSFIFPSSSFIFLLNQLCRYEIQGLSADVSTKPPNMEEDDTHKVTISSLWILSLLSIIFYPLLAVLREKYSHGVSNKGRKFANTDAVDDSTPALEIKHLTKSYKPSLLKRLCCCGRYKTTVAVDSLSFTTQKQQIMCLLGINGSGKTTTLGLIAGTESLTSGFVNINAPRSKLELSVVEHAHIWSMLKGGAIDLKILDGLIQSCDLSTKKSSPVGTLSGGQMRKVQLLCMLAGDSSICLMDEVTTGMDPVSRRAMWNIILAERSKRSIILTTHFLDECEVLADQVVIVSRGHLKCQGSTAALKNLYGGGYRVHLPNIEDPPSVPFHTAVNHGQTVITTPDSTTSARLLASLEGSGYMDTSLSGPTMEDVFLNVADEVNEVDLETSDVTPLRPGIAIDHGQLSFSAPTSNTQQLWALLLKRMLVLKRGFWWYIIALAIPLIFTPIFTADINRPNPFEPISCANKEPPTLDQPYPVNLHPEGYSDKAGTDKISMLVGPRSVNVTLFHALSRFSFAKDYDINDYEEEFLFQDDLDKLLRIISDKPSHFTPGAVYMGDKSNPPTFAYNAELGTDTGMLMQNIWSQVQSNMSIALSFAYFGSTIPLTEVEQTDAGPGLKTAIMLPDATLWSYIISLFARSELSAFGIALCATLATFAVSVISMMVANSSQSPSDGTSTVDAIVFSLGIIFPVSNLFRAMVVGLNVWAAGCRGEETISYPGSIHAYGGSILLLCVQVIYLFAVLLWLEGQSWSLRSVWARYVTTSAQIRRGDAGNGDNIEMGHITSEQVSENVAKIVHIYKTFGSNVAVDDVSLTLEKGEILALLGPNGAGKTTTISMMRGEVRPDHGSIYIKGANIHEDTATAIKNIGFCPQFDALDQLTVEQQLGFYARVKGIRDIQKDVDLVMQKVGLTPYASRLTCKLSGGNKRKLSLAIALLGNPPILILDEPSSAMDIISKRDMWTMLLSISTSRSVLLTTHSMEEADVLATRVAILSKRLLAAGTTQELRRKHSNCYEVHLVLATSPTSDDREIQKMEAWVRQSFPQAIFKGLSLGGQIRFGIPADRLVNESFPRAHGNGKSQIVKLIEILEESKNTMGIAQYTIGMGTLESVFLKIIEQNKSAKEEIPS
ncbi:ATP-binding cassette sub-family A member 9 [Fusarium acutatum]|uniref:ATP-binding cassette sub-family A member 9 n=1 Tax=Fusarium acutatum TaxID=78861 RepID=A0A8H4J986_9HYPO|nr:ATP-binding cassette sub-family A member 9 [Fusarium acutatum]